MSDFLLFCQNLKKNNRIFIRLLGAVLICIPLLYCIWIEFHIRNVEWPKDDTALVRKG